MLTSPPPDELLHEGLAFHRAARLGEAARCYRELIAVAPDNADGLHLLGLVEHAQGNHADAIGLLQRAVRLKPEAARFRFNLGTICLATGDLRDAEHHFRAALQRDPRNADFYANLGHVLLQANRPAEAKGPLSTAVALAPDAPDVLGNLGACLHRLGDYDAAASMLRRALAIDPKRAPALACLALVLEALGEPNEAEACHRAALARQPDNAACHTNLGNLLRVRGRFDEAVALLRRAASLRPNDADVWHNLAAALAGQGRGAAAEAEACCRRALRLDPGHADAHYTLGTVQLLGAKMPEGFAGLEWRWRRRGFTAPRGFDVPRWDGMPLCGRTLLLHAEQGLGDTIQMLRFVPLLADEGALVLEVPATLRALADGLHPRVRVVTAGDILPAVELECPLPSLPHALGLSLANVPEDVPYLHPAPARVAAWAGRVAGLPGKRVGLVWAGNAAYAADARRSIPPAALGPLGAVGGISWVSLQLGAPPPPGLALHDWTADLRDMQETAALVANLDAVIAVDSAVAHLAGALGRPVWLLNRFDSDWRWLSDRDRCPWYPSLRQIRQPAPGDWPSVIVEVAIRLTRCAAGGRFVRPD